MRTGYLKYNEDTRRYHFWLNDPHGCWYPDIPLHTGDCFDIKVNGKWKPTRIEKLWGKYGADAYYLVGTQLNGWELEDIEARMP